MLKIFDFFTSIDLTVAGEGGLGSLGVDGVVLAGHAGHRLLQHGDVGVVRAAAEAAQCVVAEGATANAVLRLGAAVAASDSVARLRAWCADGDENAVVSRICFS